MASTQTVVYVAATTEDARTGATALSRTADDVDVVEPATTPADVRRHAEEADCIVFAETPTTTDGVTVLQIIEAGNGTPVVLFTERSFAPGIARATEGIAGYVRRDTPDAVAHLADEIAWCRPDDTSGAASDEVAAERHRRAAERLAAESTRLSRALEHSTSERDQFETQRDRARHDRDRFRTAFTAFPDPACAFSVGPDGVPAVTAITDAFEAHFGIDPDDAVERAVLDVFETAGVTLDTAAFRDALDPERADRNWITGESQVGGDGPTIEAGAVFGRETTAGASDGPPPTDAIAAGTDHETTLDGRFETPDGVREFAITVVPPGGPTVDSRANTGLVVCTDVTDRRRAERALADSTSRIESIAELIDDGLREPLNVARGYLELAEETGDREHFAEVKSAHDSLREASTNLAGLVGREAVVEREPISLHSLARQTWIVADTGDARLELGRDVQFEGDRDRLSAVFEHLIDVATADATSSDDSSAEPAAPVVSIGATDDGFYLARKATGGEDPFVGRTAAANGTGLRLGRIERVADAHGWRVAVAESEAGTAFAFRGVDGESGD